MNVLGRRLTVSIMYVTSDDKNQSEPSRGL